MEVYWIFIIILILVIIGVIILYSTNNKPSYNSAIEKSSISELDITPNIVKITNQFDFPIWVEGKYGNNGIPIPLGQDVYVDTNILNTYTSNINEQNYWKEAATTVEIPPNSSIEYSIDPGGIAGARFWAKFSCSPCGSNGQYATTPSLCLPPYPIGCSTTNTCTFKGAGTNCTIGDSSQYYIPPTNENVGGSIGGCPPTGCSVPIDSLFEATFACTLANQESCNVNPASSTGELLGPTTYFDTSQVDGYTFPYLVLITGISGPSDLSTCINTNTSDLMPTTIVNGINSAYIDASGLITGSSGLIMNYDGNVGCPTNTNLSGNTDITTVTDSSLPITYNITDVNLGIYMDPSTGNISYPYISGNTIDGFTPGPSPPSNSIKIGCMSSCKRLNYGQPYGMNQSEGCIPGLLYCCPTVLEESGCTGTVGCCDGPSTLCINGTTNSSGLTGCISSDQCRNGPVSTSEYVTSVHNMAPGIYAYAYDDNQGLYLCGSNVKYEVVFGPSGANSTTYWNNTWNTLH